MKTEEILTQIYTNSFLRGMIKNSNFKSPNEALDEIKKIDKEESFFLPTADLDSIKESFKRNGMPSDIEAFLLLNGSRLGFLEEDTSNGPRQRLRFLDPGDNANHFAIASNSIGLRFADPLEVENYLEGIRKGVFIEGTHEYIWFVLIRPTYRHELFIFMQFSKRDPIRPIRFSRYVLDKGELSKGFKQVRTWDEVAIVRDQGYSKVLSQVVEDQERKIISHVSLNLKESLEKGTMEDLLSHPY